MLRSHYMYHELQSDWNCCLNRRVVKVILLNPHLFRGVIILREDVWLSKNFLRFSIVITELVIIIELDRTVSLLSAARHISSYHLIVKFCELCSEWDVSKWSVWVNRCMIGKKIVSQIMIVFHLDCEKIATILIATEHIGLWWTHCNVYNRICTYIIVPMRRLDLMVIFVSIWNLIGNSTLTILSERILSYLIEQ